MNKGHKTERAKGIVWLHGLHRHMAAFAGAGTFLDVYTWLGMHGSANGSPSATLVGRGDSYPRCITDDMLGFTPEHGYCRFDVAEGAARFALGLAEKAVVEAAAENLDPQAPPEGKTPIGVGVAQALTSFSPHDEHFKGGYIVLLMGGEVHRIEVQFVSEQTEADLEEMARDRSPDRSGEPDGLTIRRHGQNEALNDIALNLLLQVTGYGGWAWPISCEGNCQITYRTMDTPSMLGRPVYDDHNLPALRPGSGGWVIPNPENLVAAVPVPVDVTIVGSDGKAINATVEGGYYHVASMTDEGEVNVYASDEHRMNPDGSGGAYVEAGALEVGDIRAAAIYGFWASQDQAALDLGSVKLWRKVRPTQVIGELEGTGILRSDEGEYPFEPGDHLFYSDDKNRFWVVRRAVFEAGYLPELLAEKPEVSVIE